MLWRPFALDYWFIQAIAVYYLLAPLLMWIGKQVPLTFVFYFVVLLSMTHLKPWMLYEYHPMDWAWGRFPAFLAGMCWYQHRISSINVSWTIIGIIALTLIFVFNGSIYYWFILSMPLVVYVLGIFENWIKGTKIVPIIHFFGRYSLEIFLGHVIIYSVLSHFPIKESGWCFFWELLIALPLAFVVNRLGQSVMKRLFPN
jgi:peptidoglycan/LPS O-acetylase OafA/YrhL